ncbi:hypothetical protein KI387_000426, partial [Taxus chinensis]
IRLGHLGRKDAKDVKRRSGRKEGQGRPFWVVQKNLSRQSGTFGTKVRGRYGEPKEPRANQITPCVISRKRDREARIGWIGGICPRQFGTTGLKGREGHEKPAGPRMNQETPRVTRENVQNFKGQ